jgi:hypothetical protein
MATEILIDVKQLELTGSELAELFAAMNGEEQAEFFAKVWSIAKEWPGAGWCQQSCSIVSFAGPGAREAIRTLASHLPADDLAYIAAAGADA